MQARLVKPIPKLRLRLISSNGEAPPAVGDVGETDQCYTGPFGRQMVLVYFQSADGATEWEVEAYESDLEPVEAADIQAQQRIAAARKCHWFGRLVRRALGY